MTNIRIIPNKDEKIRIPITHVSSGNTPPKKLDAIIDTGAYTSYVGVDSLYRLGYRVDASLIEKNKSQLISMTGITGDRHTYPRKLPKPDDKIYAAFPLKLKSIRFSSAIIISSPIIYIPLSFCVVQKNKYNISFERRNIVLIGMDILRCFNFGVDIEIEDAPMFILSSPKRAVAKRNEKPTKIEFHD
jgi:hypothetical protein